jgi:hypothetical protein
MLKWCENVLMDCTHHVEKDWWDEADVFTTLVFLQETLRIPRFAHDPGIVAHGKRVDFRFPAINCASRSCSTVHLRACQLVTLSHLGYCLAIRWLKTRENPSHILRVAYHGCAFRITWADSVQQTRLDVRH